MERKEFVARGTTWITRTSVITMLLTMVFLSLIIGCSKQKAVLPAMPKFSQLSPEDRTRLEQQRTVVATAAKQRYGTPVLTETVSDLPVLQHLIDDKVFRKTQTYELQSLGIAFGDVLASELPLRWVMVTDEYGTDPTLRFKGTTVQVNALTMISKRIEKDEAVDLQELLRITREHLARIVGKRQPIRWNLVTKFVVRQLAKSCETAYSSIWISSFRVRDKSGPKSQWSPFRHRSEKCSA
jgi:hypothetical protein